MLPGFCLTKKLETQKVHSALFKLNAKNKQWNYKAWEKEIIKKNRSESIAEKLN